MHKLKQPTTTQARRLAVSGLLVPLLLVNAFAQTAPPTYSLDDVLKTGAQSWTADEIMRSVSTTAVKPSRLMRFVATGGRIFAGGIILTLGVEAVEAGLNWIKGQADKAGQGYGAALDAALSPAAVGDWKAYYDTSMGFSRYDSTIDTFPASYFYDPDITKPTRGCLYTPSNLNGNREPVSTNAVTTANVRVPATADMTSCPTYSEASTAYKQVMRRAQELTHRGQTANPANWQWYNYSTGSWPMVQRLTDYNAQPTTGRILVYVPTVKVTPLYDRLQASPEAQEQLKNVMNNYYKSTPPAAYPGTATFAPWPGTTVTPEAGTTLNKNVWQGVVVDTTLDTNGDGITDADAVKHGIDPMLKIGPDYDLDTLPNNTDPCWWARDCDADGYADNIELKKGTNPTDPKSTPAPVTVQNPQDDPDGDGWISYTEVLEGTDPYDNASHPDPRVVPKDASGTPWESPSTAPLDKAACEGSKGTWNGTTCTLPKDAEGNTPEAGCGVFTIRRFTGDAGGFLKDLVIPCQDIGDITKPLRDSLKTKFPFALIASLNTWTPQAPDGTAAPNPLPTKVGPFTLDWSPLAALFLLPKLLFTSLMGFFAVSWILKKLAGQVILQ